MFIDVLSRSTIAIESPTNLSHVVSTHLFDLGCLRCARRTQLKTRVPPVTARAGRTAAAVHDGRYRSNSRRRCSGELCVCCGSCVHNATSRRLSLLPNPCSLFHLTVSHASRLSLFPTPVSAVQGHVAAHGIMSAMGMGGGGRGEEAAAAAPAPPPLNQGGWDQSNQNSNPCAAE